MKYIFSALFIGICQSIFAVNITFQLDFSTVGVNATPEVNGTFNGWCGNCNPMTDANGDNVWEVTIDLAPGYYEYKFSYNNWQGSENLTVGSSCTNTTDIFTNRTLNVSTAAVLPVVCWNSCVSCNPTPVNVTFQVDMNNVTNNFTMPEVNGTFNGWCGNCNPMTDANSDGIWEATLQLLPGNYEFKYSADNWSIQESLTPGSGCTITTDIFTNRTLSVSSDIVLPVVCWNSCNSCSGAPSVEWELCWSDEFDGSTLDVSTWTPEIGGWGWGNNEWQYYTSNSNNINVSNGSLKITAVQENYNGSNYTSARLITNNNFEFQYGKVEARMKLPMGQGIWPAFWMLGANIENVGWPECGEIDIMEHINNETQTHGTMHWNNNGHAYIGGSTPVSDPTQYHVYGVEWDAFKVRFYVDDVFYYQFNYINNPNSEAIFTKPFFLLLNVAVGGNWPGYPDGSTIFPATMEVDYVRLYKEAQPGYACGLPIPIQANFTADNSLICQGGQVQYQNTSTGDPTEFYWEFEGGTPAFTYDENPVVVYNNSGTFSVTLQASNSTTSNTYLGANAIQVLENVTWYEDLDGDGFGNNWVTVLSCDPPVGYVNASGDCDDSNNQVYPGHAEVCGNNIDDDCDTAIDEGCVISTVANDEFVNATFANVLQYPFCSNRTVNLSDATPSAEAVTIAPNGAGQDAWYTFVASTNGARIMAQSNSCDVVLELHNASHVIFGVENETTSGQEIMVVGNLVPGQTYYLLVRNFNTTSVGSVIVCIQNLAASAPDNGLSFDNLCGHIKCDWNGAQLYTVDFTSQQDLSTYSASHTGTLIPFSMLNGIQYNQTYSVVFTTLFTLPDAAGNISSFEVVSPPYTITIENHLPVALRSNDRCPVIRNIGSFIGADRWVCGSIGYQWEFTLSDELGNALAVEPVVVNVNSMSRYVRTSNIAGIQPGDHYLVRVRPIFNSGFGTYGDAYLLCIAGGAGMVVAADNIPQLNFVNDEGFIEIYPNPNSGIWMNVQFSGFSSTQVQMNVMDALGRRILSQQYVINNSLNSSIIFSNTLSSGIYSVEFIFDDDRLMKKMIVE